MEQQNEFFLLKDQVLGIVERSIRLHPYSRDDGYAILCPECGEIWGRRFVVAGNRRCWTSRDHYCPAHIHLDTSRCPRTAYIDWIYREDSLDRIPTAVLAFELLYLGAQYDLITDTFACSQRPPHGGERYGQDLFAAHFG